MENFTYDVVGNRLTGPGPQDTNYQYNAGNQATMGKTFGHGYDNNGNQVSRTVPNSTGKGWTASWDYENRMIRMTQTRSADNRTVAFAYDPNGRRIQKQSTTTINGVPTTSTWQYFYDNDNIVYETYTSGTTTETTWYTHGAGTDEHLALERNGSYYYYLADGLGSVTTIMDSSRNVVQSYTYDSFGLPKPQTAFRNSYTYTGREWDKETGLYYYRARYYDPIEGRFVSKDPIGFDGGDINLFAYVRNNPVRYKDSKGLSASPCTDELKAKQAKCASDYADCMGWEYCKFWKFASCVKKYTVCMETARKEAYQCVDAGGN
jgi:RHS repeat-associated protein